MSEKLDKIGADRDRAKEKRDLWDARYKELCQKYIQQENTEIHEMVRAQNLTPDYMELRYHCPDCQDTGYINGKKCRCFKREEISLLYAQSNIKEMPYKNYRC